jgi:hypothetical protein
MSQRTIVKFKQFRECFGNQGMKKHKAGKDSKQQNALIAHLLAFAMIKNLVITIFYFPSTNSRKRLLAVLGSIQSATNTKSRIGA